jgi:hypothetical protein
VTQAVAGEAVCAGSASERELRDFQGIVGRCRDRYRWFDRPGRGEMADVELFRIHVALANAPWVRRIFESGTFHGRSTAVLAGIAEVLDLELVSAAYPSRHEHLDEIERIAAPRVTILSGRGERMIRQMPYDADYAVVVDGPKAAEPRQSEGWQALMRHCLYPRQRPSLIFNHDMRRAIAPANFKAFMAWYAGSGAYLHYEYELVSEAFLRTWNPGLAPEHRAFADRPVQEDTRVLAARAISNLCIMTRVSARAPAKAARPRDLERVAQ